MAERTPMRSIEISGPATPVVGMIFSISLKSSRKKISKATGSAKVARSMRVFPACFINFLDMNKVHYSRVVILNGVCES